MAGELINIARVKRYTLDQAVKTRAHKYSRVSGEFMVALDAKIRDTIDAWVRQQPSVGKTIYPPMRDHKETNHES